MTSRARPLAAPDTEAAEALSGAFRPRFPWVTGDLQTIRNVLIIELFGQRVQVPPSTLLTLPLEDATGDALVSELNLPESNPRGVVVVIHGLTGCSQSTHMLALTKNLILAGFAVVRLNLRGAGASAPHCTDTYHGGRSEDIRAALKALAVLRPEFDNLPLFMVVTIFVEIVAAGQIDRLISVLDTQFQFAVIQGQREMAAGVIAARIR